jgi:hypothetical protein
LLDEREEPLMKFVLAVLGFMFVFSVEVPAQAEETTPSVFRPDPASVQRYGPAYRFPQAGWIVLHIEGEPYERGYQHGRLLSSEVAAFVRAFAAMMSPHAPAEGWKITRRLTNALFLRRFTPEYLEEMKGIADGASAAGARFDNRPIDVVDIAATNCWPEIHTLESALEATPTGLEGKVFPHAQPRAMPKSQEMHCSAFAAVGPATADGKIVFGHITMDGLYSSNFYNVWLDVKPSRGHRVLMCSFPGGIQSGMDYYLNDAGLLMVETTITQTRFDIKGMTEASRIREAMQYANNIDKAVEILKKSNNGLYTNEWLLADINANEIALFELGTHKSRLMRSSKNEWYGNTPGFYWGCNNTKGIELRLETIPGVNARPANLVFEPSDRDILWQKLYHKYKGKIGAAFGKEAFTTPPLAAIHSCDAKFTTTDMARKLQSWCLFGPPLGRTWQPTEEERRLYSEIKPLVSNPWAVLHGEPPAKLDPNLPVAVDLSPDKKKEEKAKGKRERLLFEPAWHGTILPQSDGDTWLATAFAEYERIVAREKELRAKNDDQNLTPEDRDKLAVDLFAYRSRYLPAARASADTPLARIHSNLTDDKWYRQAEGKGVLVLNELRRVLGDDAFTRAMDTFGKENAGKTVTTAQFQAHVEKLAGKKLGDFFESWLNRTGLPTLKLAKVGLRPEKTADRRNIGSTERERTVIGEILQQENGHQLAKVDVTLETDKGEVTKTIALKGERTAFEVQSPGNSAPRRVILDKYGTAARASGGVFSVLSFYPEQEKTLIVYGTLDEVPTNREAAEALQKAIRERWSNYNVAIKGDRDVSDMELKNHHLLLIGRPDSNALVARFRETFPITFGSRSFVVRGKTYAHMYSAVAAAGDNPLNRRYSAVVLAGLCAEATLRVPPTLLKVQRAGQVLVLPYQQPAESLVIPAKELVQVLK